MWLINTTTLELRNFIDASATPKYAILSHCWGPTDSEMTFKDFRKKRNCFGPGYEKIVNCCNLVRQQRLLGSGVEREVVAALEWLWIDTVQVQMSSVYAYYRSAEVCFAYLEDFEHSTLNPADPNLETALRPCRWFTRGWTLQEMLAPRAVISVDRNWWAFGQKFELEGVETTEPQLPSLLNALEAITGVPGPALRGAALGSYYSVAQRLSWASQRHTSRIEDRAYCLLGLFGVNMPLLYGEGRGAFRRLQHEVLLKEHDESVFAWSVGGEVYESSFGQMLAPSPSCFAAAGKVRRQNSETKSPISVEAGHWQLLIPSSGPSFVFRHPVRQDLLAVRLKAVQEHPDIRAFSPCILMLRLGHCGHVIRVRHEGTQSSHLAETRSLPWRRPAEGVEILDEAGVAEGRRWKLLQGPLSLWIHPDWDEFHSCGEWSGPPSDEPHDMYLQFGEARPRVVRWRARVVSVSQSRSDAQDHQDDTWVSGR